MIIEIPKSKLLEQIDTNVDQHGLPIIKQNLSSEIIDSAQEEEEGKESHELIIKTPIFESESKKRQNLISNVRERERPDDVIMGVSSC